MSANRFVMRRDTQKHVPPRPDVHPRPGRRLQPRRDEGEAPDFWKEEERRHPHPPAPGAPDDHRRHG